MESPTSRKASRVAFISISMKAITGSSDWRGRTNGSALRSTLTPPSTWTSIRSSIDAPLGETKYLSFLLNPILEKNLVGSGSWEGSYTAQILYHWSKDFSAGVEAYGDVGKFKDMGQVHEEGAYLMPVLN